MHPENIRKIFEDGGVKDRLYRKECGCDDHTIDQLHSAWRSILAAYDEGLLDKWYPERTR